MRKRTHTIVTAGDYEFIKDLQAHGVNQADARRLTRRGSGTVHYIFKSSNFAEYKKISKQATGKNLHTIKAHQQNLPLANKTVEVKTIEFPFTTPKDMTILEDEPFTVAGWFGDEVETEDKSKLPLERIADAVEKIEEHVARLVEDKEKRGWFK